MFGSQSLQYVLFRSICWHSFPHSVHIESGDFCLMVRCRKFDPFQAHILQNYQQFTWRINVMKEKKHQTGPGIFQLKPDFPHCFCLNKKIQLWFIAWIAIFKLTNECDSIEKWYKQYVSKQITIQLNDFLIHYCQNEIAIATCWTSRTFNEYNILRDGVKKFAQKAI